MQNDYRSQFTNEEAAESYDRSEYGANSYGTLLWEIEKTFLLGLVGELANLHKPLRYMDFACGSGRVISHIEPFVDESVGIDVSGEMLSRARERVRTSRLIEGDISASPTALGTARFDLITAFRFFLNAQPSLRLRTIQALASHLSGADSKLVLNNHGNPYSHKLLMAPAQLLKRRFRHAPAGNYMTHSQVVRLLDAAGLRIDATFGYGFLSGKALRICSYPDLLAYERRLTALGFLQPFGVNRIYVASPLP